MGLPCQTDLVRGMILGSECFYFLFAFWGQQGSEMILTHIISTPLTFSHFGMDPFQAKFHTFHETENLKPILGLSVNGKLVFDHSDQRRELDDWSYLCSAVLRHCYSLAEAQHCTALTPNSIQCFGSDVRSKTSWLLATYFIPMCVERGVRLGSEILSGVWHVGHLEF